MKQTDKAVTRVTRIKKVHCSNPDYEWLSSQLSFLIIFSGPSSTVLKIDHDYIWQKPSAFIVHTQSHTKQLV
jgi:hypothetical protein